MTSMSQEMGLLQAVNFLLMDTPVDFCFVHENERMEK